MFATKRRGRVRNKQNNPIFTNQSKEKELDVRIVFKNYLKNCLPGKRDKYCG
jgi:hypothetical protein